MNGQQQQPVYQNPMWENARKALEAVSPSSELKTNREKEQSGNLKNGLVQDNSAKELYLHYYNQLKQGPGMPPRSPFFGGMPPHNGAPGFGMHSPYQPRPGFGGPPQPHDRPGLENGQGAPCGFNPRFLPGTQPPRFLPRNNMQQHPEGGGIQFNLPTRNKLHQQQQNGGMGNNQGNFNHANFATRQRMFLGASGPQSLFNNQPNTNNTPQAHVQMQDSTGSSVSDANKADDTNPNTQAAAAEWPPTLKAWVQKAFSSVTNAEEKDKMEGILKTRLTDAFTTGDAFTIDWDNEPLPFDKKENKTSPAKKKSRWDPQTENKVDVNLGPQSGHQGTFAARGMRGQRGAFQRGRGTHNQTARGRMSMGISRNSRSYSRSRSRSTSRSMSRSWSRSRSRSRSRSHSPDMHRRRISSPIHSRSRRNRSRSRSFSRSPSRSSSVSSRSSKDFYSLNTRGNREHSRVFRGRVKNEGFRGRGRGSKGRKNSGDSHSGIGKKNQISKKSPKGKVKKGGIKSFDMDAGGEGSVKLLERAKRFGDQLDKKKPKERLSFLMSSTKTQNESDEEDMEWSSLHIIGTCQDLEKQYLRISGPPNATKIRPVEVLKKSLEMVKTRWSEKMDYHYACEQMKSIRQDLTVQGIRNEFTVTVYETHARIAMEKGDHEEYNQCQTQLKLLYKEGLPGHRKEFTAYRILYYIYTSNLGDLNSALTDLTKEDRQDVCIKHALDVRSAWALCNYHKFFHLYLNAPKMAGYLMDKFVGRVRKAALKATVKAYRPTVPVDFIVPEIGFSEHAECIDFLKEMSITLVEEESKIDCKASMAVVNAL